MTHPFLADASALDAFVADWHAHRLARQAWTHAAHVAVCAYYAFDRDPDATLRIMRAGIRSFNESIGGQNTATSGYHETITRVWVMAITAHLRAAPARDRHAAACSAVRRFADPRALLRECYAHDIVNDVRARAEWVPPQPPPGWMTLVHAGAEEPAALTRRGADRAGRPARHARRARR